jgi:glyoxylase-like metal-dependent hydrolase (beta-lactamase superfamily II)
MPVTRIPVDGPTRAPSGRTTAHIVELDGESLLVDPPAQADALDTAIHDHDVGHVAVTHHHPDHVGGVAAYAREEELTVWALAGRGSAFEAATGVAPDRLFRPGERMIPGVEVVDTPGHAPEHVAFVAGDEWLTGDLAVAAGSVVVGAPEGDMRAYLSSLRRVHARNPRRLFPAHGPVIEDPRGTCERLIAHRLDREALVLDAVRAGHERPEALVEAAYDKDISDVLALAEATVVAHLSKLAHEGKILWDGERARLA